MNMTKGRAMGAADFKKWYMVVWLTPGPVDWPRYCACCLRRPEGTALAEKDGQLVAEYPICRLCRQHAKRDDVALGISLAVGVLVIGGGWIALFGFSIMVWIGLQLILMLLGVLLVAGACHWLLGQFMGSKLPRCASEGWPVEPYSAPGLGKTLGNDAERTDQKNLRLWCEQAASTLGSGAYGLQFRNYDYARKFIEANGGDSSKVQTIHEAY